jgi:mRNA interferase MazF
MPKKREIYQGQIYICNLGDNYIGSEQYGERPCLIIQNNILNSTSDVVIIVPITSKRKKQLPTHYVLSNAKYPFLNFIENTVLCECIRSLSKKRLGKFIGQIENDDLEQILKIKEYAYKNANKITKERRICEWQ